MIRSLFLRLSNSRSATATCVVLVFVLFTLIAVRTYREYSTATGTFDFSQVGMSDFHNGAYYPALAFRNGVNPYSAESMEHYPLSRPAPTYSPLVFCLHIPFTFLEVKVADAVFFVFNFALLGILAWMAVKFGQDDSKEAYDSEMQHPIVLSLGFWLVLLLIVLSRPGHITMVTGYFTAEMVIGAMLAIHYARRRPVVSGLGLMLTSMKPTFVIPLALLMLFRKNFKAVFFGGVFSVLVASAGLLWLAQDSSVKDVFVEIERGQQALHDDPTELPINTWTRTDITGMVAKVMNSAPNDKVYLAVMVVLLVIPGIAVYRLSGFERQGAASLSGAIISVSVLLSIYHHSYDCLLLVVPWAGLAFFGCMKEMRVWERSALVVLLATVAGNYLSTQTARNRLGLDQLDPAWQAITLINGICLLIALVILLTAAFRIAPSVSSREIAAHPERLAKH